MNGVIEPPWKHCRRIKSPTALWPFGTIIHEHFDLLWYYLFGGPDRDHGSRSDGRQERGAASAMNLIEVVVDDTGYLEDGMSMSDYHGHDVHSSREMARYFMNQITKKFKWNKAGGMAYLHSSG